MPTVRGILLLKWKQVKQANRTDALLDPYYTGQLCVCCCHCTDMLAVLSLSIIILQNWLYPFTLCWCYNLSHVSSWCTVRDTEQWRLILSIVFVTFQNNIRILSRTMAYNCWDWIRAWFSSKIDLPAQGAILSFKGYYDHGNQDSLS